MLSQTNTRPHVQYPLSLSDYNQTIFSPVGAELFRADGQTDMTKRIVAFEILST
jgi:hypothetical protein